MTRGFTLIELLVVVLVIGILAAVALPQYQTAVERARATEALTQMRALQDSLERYHSQHEAWPANNVFARLDVDIPTITLTNEQKALCTAASDKNYYGGKHFCLSFTSTSGGGGNPPTATITATRLRDNNSYTLQTVITAQNNGTYTAVRTCTAGSGPDASAYCQAISGGKENF